MKISKNLKSEMFDIIQGYIVDPVIYHEFTTGMEHNSKEFVIFTDYISNRILHDLVGEIEESAIEKSQIVRIQDE